MPVGLAQDLPVEAPHSMLGAAPRSPRLKQVRQLGRGHVLRQAHAGGRHAVGPKHAQPQLLAQLHIHEVEGGEFRQWAGENVSRILRCTVTRRRPPNCRVSSTAAAQRRLALSPPQSLPPSHPAHQLGPQVVLVVAPPKAPLLAQGLRCGRAAARQGWVRARACLPACQSGTGR